jgi:hypothetical protein
MKRTILTTCLALLGLCPYVHGESDVTIKNLVLTGQVQGENVSFTLDVTADVRKRGARLTLTEGDLVYMEGQLPKGVTIERRDQSYELVFESGGWWFGDPGERHAVLTFAALAARQDDWRSATFGIPNATIRQLAMVCDRDDLDIQFPGALQVERHKNAAGKTEAVAYLTPGSPFSVRWKPQVRKLEGELAVTCDGRTVAVAGVGALKLDTVFTYRVVQGELSTMALDVPELFNVTQVTGEDIREWHLEAKPGGGRQIAVVLSRPKDKLYALRVEGERVLSAFPCKFDLPVVVPTGVIRASGFLLIGTDSAVKLLAGKAAGLTQIDPAAYPRPAGPKEQEPRIPARTAYAYQYAHVPFQMELSAEDVVTALSADQQTAVSYEDNAVAVQAAVDIEVRDAPAREVVLETDPAWAVSQVQGAKVADYDVRDLAGKREIRVYFQEAVLGRVLVTVKLERTLAAGTGAFIVPRLTLRSARAERGYLVLRAEKGVRLKEQKAVNLREVHAASVPFRVPEAQRAYRFKSPDWSLEVGVEQADAALHAELFHLFSLGEGALYGSVSITYRIEGAPVRRLQVRVPAACQNIEFTGRDVRGWERQGDTIVVSLQEKVLGDYTLLMTFDQPFAYEGAELTVGAIETTGTVSEVGYIALSGPASLTFDAEKTRDPSMITIASEELPREYALLVNDPVLKAYKYVRAPHLAQLAVRRYSTQPLLDHVADHISLRTRLSREGEAVTEATYFVKNTSQQFLSLKLPDGARLWSTRVDGEPVRALDDGKGVALIPIKRLQDANTPSRVELVYAEGRPKLRWLSSLVLKAPLSVAQSVFARWTVIGPEKMTLVPSDGNMMPPAPPPAGLKALLEAVWAVKFGIWSKLPVFVVATGILCAWVALLFFRVGRGLSWGTGLVAVLALVTALGACWAFALDNPARGCGGTFNGRPATAADVAFTKAVTMSDRELSVGVRVVPVWMGGAGGFIRLVAGGLVGVVVCLVGWRAQRRTAWLAAGLTLLVWSAAGMPRAIPLLAGLLVTGVTLALLIGAWRWAYQAGRARGPALETLPAEPPPFVEPDPATSRPEQGAAPGGPWILLLAMLTGLSLAATALAAEPGTAETPAPAEPPQGPVMQDVQMKIEAPDPAREKDGIARIELTLTFETREAASVHVFPANYVLIESTLKAGEGTLSGDKSGYSLALRSGGTYTLTFKGYAPVVGKAGAWSLPVDLPPHLKNRVEIVIPATGWEVTSPDAAWLQVVEKDKRTLGSLILASGQGTAIVWQPRERKTRLEQTVFFCDVQTYAVVAPGLINLTHLVQYQIAQGELQTLKFKIPDGMTVTAVSAPGLGTWRFDPETRLLEAIMEKPVSGDLTLQLTTQVPREGLPYEAVLAMPTVEGATRQRGSLALAAGSAVQVQADEPKGMSAMNLGDFAPEAAQAALRNAHYAEPPEIKRAFRYHELPAVATIHAESVLPELRVVEQASLDISDERLVLSTRLEVTIARAGIFDLRLTLPESFDVESITGDDLSHWDEVREGGHGVIVHFRKQTLGLRTINLVLGRMEKGVEAQVAVPRVGVSNAVKHVGTLAVSGERGVRFLTAQRDGVSEIHPRELGIEQPGYLAFRLLRPDWTVVLKTETLAPVVRADVLQRLDISEGMIRGHAVIQYKIDQAGVKTFRLKAPAPEVALTVSGRSVSKVNLIDKEAGLWEVELQGKVEGRQALDVTYQQSCDPQAGILKVLPLQTVGTDAQKGYAVVFTAGRLQIKANGVPAGLHEDDARNVPGDFGAGDLSDAILCYRTTRPDYALDLTVVRHASAEVLPARVQSVRMVSVLADDGQMVTRVDLRLGVGTLRFLEVTLPEGAQSWSVFVNGTAAMPLKDGGKLMIPLEAGRGKGEAGVELTYAGQAGTGSLFGRRRLEGPRFNVPLADLRWDLYAPPGHRYSGFGGTLTFREPDRADGTIVFDAAQYEQVTRNAVLANNAKAEEVLHKGESLWKEGKQAQAKQALAEAVAFSQGQQGLNEDARIQYRNLMRQQAVVGFYNRRAALKKARNVWDDGPQTAPQAQPQGRAPSQAGEWTAEYGRQVEQSLGQEDADNLNKVADKMLEQQAAAQVRANPIRVTVPVQGVHLPFYRELQITPATEIAIEFKTGSGRLLGWLVSAGAAFALLAVFWGVAWLFTVRRA